MEAEIKLSETLIYWLEAATSWELTRNEESWTLPESEFIRSPVDSEAW